MSSEKRRAVPSYGWRAAIDEVAAINQHAEKLDSEMNDALSFQREAAVRPDTTGATAAAVMLQSGVETPDRKKSP